MIKKLFLIIILLLSISSCDKKSRKLVIKDFSKPISDNLVPNEDPSIGYSVAICKVKGHSNDTISISFWGRERKFTGTFSYEWNMDYYGKQDVGFEFKPLRATKGEIEVEYQIE